MDEEFTCQIHQLLATLKKLDRLDASGIHLTIMTPTRETGEEGRSYQGLYSSWRVHLPSPENLPSVNCVGSLFLVKAPEKQA